MEVEDNGGENLPTKNAIDSGGNLVAVPDFVDAFLVDANTNSGNTQHLNRAFAYTQYLYLNARKKKVKKSPSPVSSDSLLLQKYDSLAALPIDTTALGLDSLLGNMDSLGLDSIKTDIVVSKNLPKNSIEKLPPNGAADLKNKPKIDPKGKPMGGKGQRPSGRPAGIAPPSPPPVSVTDFTKKRAFTIYHRLRYQKEKYKFWDASPAADSSYYGNLQVDNRGLRYLLERKMVENTLKLQTFKLRKDELK